MPVIIFDPMGKPARHKEPFPPVPKETAERAALFQAGKVEEDFIQQVYETLTGQLIESYRVPGVENAYADGSFCEQKYADVYYAYQRLLEKLKAEEFDPDVEIIINSLLEIEETLCRKMYELGARFGMATD